jgi:hypothetical protein
MTETDCGLFTPKSVPGIFEPPCMLIFYGWHMNFCYGMSHCLCSGLMEVIVVAQAQHINSRKYTSSYTISSVPRNFFWRGVQQIQLRTEGREKGNLGAVTP